MLQSMPIWCGQGRGGSKSELRLVLTGVVVLAVTVAELAARAYTVITF